MIKFSQNKKERPFLSKLGLYWKRRHTSAQSFNIKKKIRELVNFFF